MLDGIGSLARQHVRRMCLVNHQRLDVELMPTGPPPPPTPSSANYARRATRTQERRREHLVSYILGGIQAAPAAVMHLRAAWLPWEVGRPS